MEFLHLLPGSFPDKNWKTVSASTVRHSLLLLELRCTGPHLGTPGTEIQVPSAKNLALLKGPSLRQEEVKM